jgi:hypothetical protein
MMDAGALDLLKKNADAEATASAFRYRHTRTFVSAAPVPGRVREPAAAMHYPRDSRELRAVAGKAQIPSWWVG